MLSALQKLNMTKLYKAAFLLALITISLGNLTSENSADHQYRAWKVRHGKDFSEHEDRYRLFLFQQKQQSVKAHNENPQNTYTKETNKFAAETHEQLILKYTGAVPPKDKDVEHTVKLQRKVGTPKLGEEEAYELINWTELNKVNPAVDQGSCGGCWAFTTVDSIQSAYLIKNDLNATQQDENGIQKNTIALSVQQLIDCSYFEPNANGCQGGWMDTAMDYATILGITYEEDYPYTSGTTGKDGECKKHGGQTKIRKFNTISTRDNCVDVMPYIYKGPVIVPIFATWDMFSYKSGIFSCSKSEVTEWHFVNHAVVITGIADQDGTFIIKQTWGQDFGQNGYMKLDRHLSCNVCSNSEAFVPEF